MAEQNSSKTTSTSTLPLSVRGKMLEKSSRSMTFLGGLTLVIAVLALLIGATGLGLGLANQDKEEVAAATQTFTPTATFTATATLTPTPLPSPTPQAAFSVHLFKSNAMAEAYVGSLTPLILLVQGQPANAQGKVMLEIIQGSGGILAVETLPGSDAVPPPSYEVFLDEKGIGQAAFYARDGVSDVIITASVYDATTTILVEADRLEFTTRQDVLILRMELNKPEEMNRVGDSRTITLMLESVDKTPFERKYPVTVSINDNLSPIQLTTDLLDVNVFQQNLAPAVVEMPVNQPYTINATLNLREFEPFNGVLTLTVESSWQPQVKAEVSIPWGTTCILTNTHTGTVPYFLIPGGQGSKNIQIAETAIVKSKNAEGWYEIDSAGLSESPDNPEQTTVWIQPGSPVTVSPQAYCDSLVPVEATPESNGP